MKNPTHPKFPAWRKSYHHAVTVAKDGAVWPLKAARSWTAYAAKPAINVA